MSSLTRLIEDLEAIHKHHIGDDPRQGCYGGGPELCPTCQALKRYKASKNGQKTFKDVLADNYAGLI